MDLPASEETIMSPPKRVKRKNHGWGAKSKSHRVVKNPASEALKELEKIPLPMDGEGLGSRFSCTCFG